MANDTQIISGLYLSISAVGLLILFNLYRDYKKDQVRDDLFGLRDQLFDYAVDEKILDHPGYIKLREIINAMIRYAHRISLLQLILWTLAPRFVSVEGRKLNEQWMAVLNDLPKEKKDRLINYHDDMMMIVFSYLLKNSIFGIIFFEIFVGITLTFKKIKKWVLRALLERS